MDLDRGKLVTMSVTIYRPSLCAASVPLVNSRPAEEVNLRR